MVRQADLDTSWSLVTDARSLDTAAERLSRGTGPVGVDAERASGFRYGSEAYLVQVHRHDAGTFLFDPTELQSFAPLADALEGEEWILHAASQDLPCLAALDLRPTRLFDTELASRLLGYERVALGTIVELLLGIELNKAHSASDWSVRPLPESWLEYAALDVALLPELRDAVARELDAQGKRGMAEQEFAAVLSRPDKAAAIEPWRRLSGAHRLRSPRELAVARELWMSRDDLARDRDVAPGRLLPDASIVVAAAALPRSAGELARLRTFAGRASRTELDRWWSAVLRGKVTEDLPGPPARDPDALPHHRGWSQRHPEAAGRLQRARDALAAESERRGIPLENLLVPDTLRRLCWSPPADRSPEAVTEELARLGAREWQREIVAPLIAGAIVEDD